MREFPDFTNMDDDEILLTFIDWTQNSLNDLAAEPYDSEDDLLFHEELLDPMRSALEELNPHWNELRKEIDNIEEDQFMNHGLYGAQLRFKIASIGIRVRTFLRNRSKFLLRRALNAINTLLKSILDAAGVGTAISEVKDSMRDAVSDQRD